MFGGSLLMVVTSAGESLGAVFNLDFHFISPDKVMKLNPGSIPSVAVLCCMAFMTRNLSRSKCVSTPVPCFSLADYDFSTLPALLMSSCPATSTAPPGL